MNLIAHKKCTVGGVEYAVGDAIECDERVGTKLVARKLAGNRPALKRKALPASK